MVSKATNNSLRAANAKSVKGRNRRTPKKGSRVTEARSKAQRDKLDKATEVRQAQEQKRKYSPGDHLPTRIPGPRETRRRSTRAKEQRGKR